MSCHDYIPVGVMLVLCSPLQVKCNQKGYIFVRKISFQVTLMLFCWKKNMYVSVWNKIFQVFLGHAFLNQIWKCLEFLKNFWDYI